MYNIVNIYQEFRRAQAHANNRGYRMPKDFDKHFNTKMSEKSREVLSLITKFFNTKWQNIDPYGFFECGFELFKSFTYTQFFDPRVINLYVQRDKNHKREMNINKQEISYSLNFVKEFITDNNIKDINEYGKLRDGNINLAVKHYLDNKIDKYLMVYLISMGIIKLTDDDRVLIPYIVEHYRDCLVQLDRMKGVVK